jgi:hypothetical protein
MLVPRAIIQFLLSREFLASPPPLDKKHRHPFITTFGDFLEFSARICRIFHRFYFFKNHIGSTAVFETCEILDDFAVRVCEVGKYIRGICTPGCGISWFGNLGE